MAHPVSLSSALVDIREGEIVVELQIMLEDLVLYHRLKALSDRGYSASDLETAAKKHRQFLQDYFSIFDGDGHRLQCEFVGENFEQINPQGVRQEELMNRGIDYQFRFPLGNARPEYLTFLQNFGGKDSALPAVMELYLLRNGVVEETVPLNFNRPFSVRLSWNRERSTAVDGSRKPESWAEIRQRRKEESRARLGIASYSGLYSFLYINRYEVRHEILIPLLTLEEWVPIERRDPDFLEVDEQVTARQGIERFLVEKSRVAINGALVKGTLARVNFFTLDINDFALNAEPRRINVYQARVGAILSFPSRTVPRSVTAEWETFSEQAPFLNTVLLIGNDKPARFVFHHQAKQYTWSGDLARPPLVLPPKNASLTDSRQRQTVVEQVLTNIYSAFDFRHDEDVYDALATSVHGDLLREVYLRMKRSLLMAEQGGTLAHASRVAVLKTIPRGPDEYETTWRVTSVAEHWGHLHTQVTEFRGLLKLAMLTNAWKLVSFQLLDEKRVQFETSIRGNDPNPGP